MLYLPTVTLFAIDCVRPALTLRAMRESMKLVEFGRAILITDTARNGTILNQTDHTGIDIIPHRQTDRKESPYPGYPPLAVDYERDALIMPVKHVWDSSHVLFMEWDSCVLNPDAWDASWFKYDFIGAPWPKHRYPGWPDCDGETNAVGNGGFSLRSKAFCEATENATVEFANDPEMVRQMKISDAFFSRSIRSWMEHHDIRYAPPEVAARFSCENRVYSGQFGFHGKGTAAINNWGGWMAAVR